MPFVPNDNGTRDKLMLARFLKEARYLVGTSKPTLGEALLSRLDLDQKLRKDSDHLSVQRIENLALILLIEVMREHRDEIVSAILSSTQKIK